MKSKSYSPLQKKYGGKFIAMMKYRVIASATTLKMLWQKVRRKIGNPNLIIEYMEPHGQARGPL